MLQTASSSRSPPPTLSLLSLSLSLLLSLTHTLSLSLLSALRVIVLTPQTLSDNEKAITDDDDDSTTLYNQLSGEKWQIPCKYYKEAQARVHKCLLVTSSYVTRNEFLCGQEKLEENSYDDYLTFYFFITYDVCKQEKVQLYIFQSNCNKNKCFTCPRTHFDIYVCLNLSSKSRNIFESFRIRTKNPPKCI